MLSSQEIAQFRSVCSSFGVDLSEEMIERFRAYASLLLEWNKRIHLVSKGDAKSDRILRHFVDSLCIFKILDIPKNSSLLDLGSGAGFPGVPIKIVRNNVKMTLVESVRKKTLFLQKLSGVLKLEKVTILNQRAEELTGQAEFQGKFDVVAAKALGKLTDTIRLSIPFLKPGGSLVAYKGRAADKEIRQTSLSQGCQLKDVARIMMPEMDIVRWLVLIERIA
jgi:16S rRNA (guanine527-N7)-methyltransferase